jgi:hypothetical protein
MAGGLVVNIGEYTPAHRRVLSGAELASMAARRPAACEVDDPLATAARLLEGIPAEELAGLYADASAIAGELEQPAEVRRFAAILASAAEQAHDGLVDWDLLAQLGDATNEVTRKVNDGR